MWDGEERRHNSQRGFCEAHIPMTNDLAVIKTTLFNIEKQITQGITFKTAVVSALIGVIVTLFIQMAVFAFLYGKLVNQVEVNTIRLNKLEIK